ncbi:MAG: L,D-transpeptidase [Akkermansiaceae bacterium]|jgi:lipoprotein-anchoring transpeptidase ErfK/SrfK|nr:L,D-transpeptidase [Akkermansiaceae bacterium]MDP4646575.1 L,D-transpeptidase [Akkermansiaceae bacterium]MDP4720794.1 L,D-transpeptidase [Akkermansiaceae bacterium]MDP4781129.1 L,D-transpeptidase [Akkermansiaceae bacterium]MDP4896729.1 L,D-transpeptidase [Akkermansiaceae bacterium]
MKTGFFRLLIPLVAISSFSALTSCGPTVDTRNKMIVSVRDQKMLLLRDGKPVKSYKVSTSKFGVGDIPSSNRTPLGRMKIAKKIGGGQPAGAVFKSRQPTGEVLKPNAPGRDPIVSRILWLTGTESHNRNAFRRYIYIHGTPEQYRLGTPASYGCIRMGSKEVVDLYNRVGTGADVYVIRGSLSEVLPKKNHTAFR